MAQITCERENEEDNKNMLCDLPDCILIHMLSFMNVKYAVQTCILSTRWKNLWKHLPTLTLNSYDFVSYDNCIKFVKYFMFLHDSSIVLNHIDIDHRGNDNFFRLLETIMICTASYKVKSLRLYYYTNYFPASLFSCRSLTSLVLYFPSVPKVVYPNSLNLPALTYLKLGFLSFRCGSNGRVEPFSNLNRLNTLILRCCIVLNERPLCISSTELRNLSIYTGNYYEVYSKIELSTPNLCSFSLTGNGSPIVKLNGSSSFSIKQVSVDVCMATLSHSDTPSILLNWLLELVNIQSLTIPAYTLEILSVVPDLLKVKPPWFNLKTLKITRSNSRKVNAKLPEAIEVQSEPNLSILDGMIDFLLQNSPSAKVEL